MRAGQQEPLAVLGYGQNLAADGAQGGIGRDHVGTSQQDSHPGWPCG